MTILAGKIDESVVEILTSESGVLRYEEVSGETVNPFTVDADTLGGSTKEEIISEAQSGVDLTNVDAATLGGNTKEQIIASALSQMNSSIKLPVAGENPTVDVAIDFGAKPSFVIVKDYSVATIFLFTDGSSETQTMHGNHEVTIQRTETGIIFKEISFTPIYYIAFFN